MKYIFKYIFRDQGKDTKVKKEYGRPLYVPKGVWLSKKDWHYLRVEQADKKLMADFKAKYPDYNYKAYIQNHLMPKEDKAPFIIRHNMRARSLNGFIREFESNERGRIHKRSDQTSIHHTILSWSNKDSALVTEKMLRDISREYIRLRGENNMYVGTVHTDKSHIHLHIAMSGTTLEGKSARISKQEFENVKVKLQEYQLQHYPELSHSLPKHGKAGRDMGRIEIEKIKRNERFFGKNSILQCIETNYPKAISTKQFISLLNQNGYAVYYRNGTLTGIQNEQGYKYRFSRLGVDLEYLKQLDHTVAQEKENLKELRQLRGVKSRELRLSEIKEDSKNEKAVELETEQERDALKEIQEIRAGYDNEQDRGDDRDGNLENDQDIDKEPDTDEKDNQTDNDDEQDTGRDDSKDDDSDDDSEP